MQGGMKAIQAMCHLAEAHKSGCSIAACWWCNFPCMFESLKPKAKCQERYRLDASGCADSRA